MAGRLGCSPPDEALLKVEQLNSWPFRVVEDFDEEVPQVHLDARLQFGQRLYRQSRRSAGT